MILLGHGPSLSSSRISTSSSPLTCPLPRVDFFVFRHHPLSLSYSRLRLRSPSLQRKTNGGFLLFALLLGLGRPTFPRGLLSPSPFHVPAHPLSSTRFFYESLSRPILLPSILLFPSDSIPRIHYYSFFFLSFFFSFFPTIILPCPPPCSRERQESSPEDGRFIADGVAIRKRLCANSRDLNRMIRFWEETYPLSVG